MSETAEAKRVEKAEHYKPRKLARQVAKHNMKMAGIRRINRKMFHWRDFVK